MSLVGVFLSAQSAEKLYTGVNNECICEKSISSLTLVSSCTNTGPLLDL